MQLLGLWDIYQKERQCKYRRNTEAFSGNNGYRGKAISISYSECVSVALAIQQAMRMCRITLSHKGDDFRGKNLPNVNCVF